MLLSLNWLKDFVHIPRGLSPEELGQRLTMYTVEVESVMKQADKFKNVVVAKILEIKKHPNADKLQLVKLKTKQGVVEVVCGATNIAVGQLVPLALPGAILPNGLEIKEAEIRGVRSNGMLCAEDELGLGQDHSGILILGNQAKISENLADYLKVHDVIFEVDNKSITHRPDLWSHYGLAREISTFLRTKLNDYKVSDLSNLTAGIKEKAAVTVKDFKLCPRYMAIAMARVKIEPSPKWLQDRLIAVGVRPISNIVDATNYVMIEVGQPMHAFDYDLIKGVIVRRAEAGERVVTLDGVTRELDQGMLVIADTEKAIAVAGIMGGASSEINDNTTAILLEAANFDFISVRRTAQKLGLRTEASIRFEKSLDPNLCAPALSRAVDLIREICPKAKVTSQVIDAKSLEHWRVSQNPIDIDLTWLHKFIGESTREKKIIEILEYLGFSVSKIDKKIRVIAPTWRATKDISLKEDVAEEVARFIGYDNIIPQMPKVEIKVPEFFEELVWERKIKNILIGAPALTEAYNYSFVGEEQLKKLGSDYKNHIRLANPIASNQNLLRQSLVPNLIMLVKTNQARFTEFGLFEIGSVYLNLAGELDKGDESEGSLPYQEKRLAILLAGENDLAIFQRIKGIIAHLLDNLNLLVLFNPTETLTNWADGKMSAKIIVYEKLIGFIYKLSPEAAGRLGIKKEAVIAEISLRELFKFLINKPVVKYKEFARFPSATRDLAFVINEKVLYNDIRAEILNYHPFIKKAELFDVYTGQKLGLGKKNLAFHIIYQADKTLTSEEVDEIQKGLIKKVADKFEAKIRDF